MFSCVFVFLLGGNSAGLYVLSTLRVTLLFWFVVTKIDLI
jgi:hypothetical protein